MNQSFTTENDALIKTRSQIDITVKFDIVTLIILGIIILGGIVLNKTL